MNKTVCDLCGEEIPYRQGYEIRARGMQGECNRHMCETCFMRLIINGEQRKEGQEDV